MICVDNLELTYPGNVRAIDGVSFEVTDGVIFTLLGPSGCGKTSTLRCIAGLERPDRGEIRIGSEVVYASSKKLFVPPNKRKIGMVFQSYAIWPHMSVFDNVAYPLRSTRMSKAEIERSTREVLEVVGLGHLATRPAPLLSGGQQQRVALARALVARPEVLLLDEPLSNLDAKLREEMRQELKQVQRRFGITTIYVTHDQEEALALSDIIVIMNAGEIVEMGKPRELYQRPRSQFAADFLGLANHLRGTLSADSSDRPGLRRVDTAIGPVVCQAPENLVSGEEALISIRPEDIVISRECPQAAVNCFRGRVTSATFLGHSQDCWVAVGDHRLRIRAHPHFGIEVDEEIYLVVRPEHCAAIRPSSIGGPKSAGRRLGQAGEHGRAPDGQPLSAEVGE